MFQNDDSQQRELFAASAHQTNSALSSHIIRLSRGRAQALLLAFFILASWFHLVAQLQTCVSLALLAVIGCLLSQTTGRQSHASGAKSVRCRAKESHEVKRKMALLEAGQHESDTSETRRRPSSSKQPAEEDGSGPRGDSIEEDPLISNASTVLDLLRSLRRNSADSHCSASESIELDTSAETKQSSIQLAHLDHLHKLHVPRRRALSQSQSSPGGSSSSSTGYNSDSRPAASVNLLDDKPSPRGLREPQARELDDELEMIELLRNEPSAMRLIMEQLGAIRVGQKLDVRPLSKQLDRARSAATFRPDYASRSSRAGEQSRSLGRPTCPNNAGPQFSANELVSIATSAPQIEPIYSIPARTDKSPDHLAAPSADLISHNEERRPQPPPPPSQETNT